jgi:hypothetical protein
MKRVCIFFSVLFFFTALALYPESFKFTYGFTAYHDQAREELLVPMRWSGPGGGIQIALCYQGDTWSFATELGLSLSYLEERFGNGGALMTPSLLLEGYGRIVEKGPLSINLGTLLRSRISDAYLFSWDDAHLYYLSSHMLGPTATLEWNGFDKSMVTLGMRLPSLGFVGRPHEQRFIKQDGINHIGFYFSEPNSHLAFAMPPSYYAFELSCGIEWPTRRSHMRLTYILDYERYTEPRSFTRFRNAIVFSHDIVLWRSK